MIKDFVEKKQYAKDGIEPYPLSLRGINWIKFLSRKCIKDLEIDKVLYNDYMRLVDQLEFHLLANHLLENGFSLLFGAYYFRDDALYRKAKKILTGQLEEQILNDGAHYELSPMYHQIILHRLLDSIQLVKNNHWKQQELLSFLEAKATAMLSWLAAICFKDYTIPYVNDSAPNIAPTPLKLVDYAQKLGLKSTKSALRASGYRKWETDLFEIMLDVGQIAPSYQPGHSHADNLQFVLHCDLKPIVVDTGISTYEKNEVRQQERSTAAHNTVAVDGLNSSKVWGGFRVGKRAKTEILSEEKNNITASHNGYRNLGITHKRNFEILSNSFQVKDAIEGSSKNKLVEGHIHFHPDRVIKLMKNGVFIDENLSLKLTEIEGHRIENYYFAAGYNKRIKAKKLIYTINKECTITFGLRNKANA